MSAGFNGTPRRRVRDASSVAITERTVWTIAQRTIEQHGAQAVAEAQRLAAAFLLASDGRAWLFWSQVVCAIEELERKARRDDELAH